MYNLTSVGVAHNDRSVLITGSAETGNQLCSVFRANAADNQLELSGQFGLGYFAFISQEAQRCVHTLGTGEKESPQAQGLARPANGRQSGLEAGAPITLMHCVAAEAKVFCCGCR